MRKRAFEKSPPPSRAGTKIRHIQIETGVCRRKRKCIWKEKADREKAEIRKQKKQECNSKTNNKRAYRQIKIPSSLHPSQQAKGRKLEGGK